MTEAADLVTMVVDEEKCIGAGQCEMLEEDTFYVDDDTVIAQVIGTGQLARERANLIVETCPSQAISILGRDSRPTSAEAADSSSSVEEPPSDGSEPAGESA